MLLNKNYFDTLDLGGSYDTSEIRTSKSTFIEDHNNTVVDNISFRINLITGLQTTRMYDEFDEAKTDEYENFQVYYKHGY